MASVLDHAVADVLLDYFVIDMEHMAPYDRRSVPCITLNICRVRTAKLVFGEAIERLLSDENGLELSFLVAIPVAQMLETLF